MSTETQATFLYPPTAAIEFRLLEPFDQADESHANAATGLQVVNISIEVALGPVNSSLQNDTEVVVSIVGGTATGMYTATMPVLLRNISKVD